MTNINNTKNPKKSTQNSIVLTAMFAAMICVTTIFPRLPTAIGYIHLGDSIIYLAASILPLPFAVLSASIGGGLADLFSAPVWVIPTVIIKALITLPFWAKGDKIVSKRVYLLLILSGMISISGYFITSCILYGFAAATVELIPSLTQAVSSAIVFTAIGLALDKANIKNRLRRF